MKKGWTVIDAKKGVLRCDRCKDEVPIPLGSVDWVIGVIRAFGKGHRYCKPGRGCGQTTFMDRNAK